MARIALFVLLMVMASTATAQQACPAGFISCGETNQLCCPQ